MNHSRKQDVEDRARRWIDARGHLKESTRSQNAGLLENDIAPRWGRTALPAVTYADAQTWVAEQTRNGVGPCQCPGFAPPRWLR